MTTEPRTNFTEQRALKHLEQIDQKFPNARDDTDQVRYEVANMAHSADRWERETIKLAQDVLAANVYLPADLRERLDWYASLTP
jgi:hypothetical protein